jgi:hypothetical protein
VEKLKEKKMVKNEKKSIFYWEEISKFDSNYDKNFDLRCGI